MLKWDQKYELGHARIDAEHRIFLGLVVNFHESANQGASKEKLIRILNEISKYAEFHFVSEENIMVECDYPELEEQVKSHRMLLDQVKYSLSQFRNGGIESKEVFDFLFNWFALHTSKDDKKLVGHIEENYG